MHTRLIALILIMLLLAACGTPADETAPDGAVATEEPTPNENISPIIEEREDPPGGPTRTPDPRDPDPQGIQLVPPTPTNEEAPFALPLAGPGTLVASETEDPEAHLIFDRLRVTRTGGPVGNDTLEIVVEQSGAYTRNGAPGTLSTEQVTEIDSWLDDINFFGLQGTFMGAGAPDTAYFYTITVDRGAFSRSITAVDRFMPDPLKQLVADLLDIGA